MTAAVMPPSDAVNMPRAASYTFLPALKDTIFDEAKGTFSEDDLIGPTTTTFEVQLSRTSGRTTPDVDSNDVHESSDMVMELGSSKRTPILLPKLETGSTLRKAIADRDLESSAPRSAPPVEGRSRRNSFSRSFSQKLRPQSWMTSSRSPSPRKAASREQSPAPASPSRRTPNVLSRRTTVVDTGDKTARSRSSSLSRKGAEFARKFGRPLSTISNGIASEHSTPIDPISSKSLGLPKSWSSEKLPLPSVLRSIPSSERVPPVPRIGSSEKMRNLRPEFRKKDELWSVFRTLDGDVQKFNTKPSALKTNVVRASLLPFLRSYRSHESALKLRPEDLDRRTTILNKWWTGLLELLHGRNNQSVSPTERPVIFEAIVGIMERPEWRLAPSPFCPLRDRKSSNPASSSASSTSLSSEESDFLQESINHNVRNNFVQNLLAQMNFALWRMSERNTPASLVQFCGKTIAYAFFFCEGIADVLVRLWSPSMDLLKRVINEAGLQGFASLGAVSKQIVNGFPPSIRSLEFTGLASTYRNLRKPITPPLGTHDAPWNSPSWINRWNGKDSELFYVFVKHYHFLLMDFLPEQATKKERLSAPGLVMVHAQILANIDGTIHRHTANEEEQQRGASNITFDDVLGGDPDASAPSLPFAPATNANRLMAENRVIMLVRDFLSDRNPIAARRVFAEAFSDVLKAAARKTSVYDHAACYTLCDLLEEAVVLLVRYEHATELEHAVLDFSFWLKVFKRMVHSQNTTTEIRLYSLLYSLWASITLDPYRKRDICRVLLLEPDLFHGRFNHWCPMVRAYYMRLLCWRVGRYDGDGEPRDIDIFRTLSERLHTVYGHYTYLRQDAQLSRTLEPSTTPCNPAPGRYLIIVRTDPLISTARGLSSFTLDGITSPQSAVLRPRPISRSSTSSSEQEDDNTKRWGLLRTIIGTSKQQRTRSESPTKKEPASQSNIAAPARKSSPLSQQQQQQQQQQSEQPPFRSFCFKFSLEFTSNRRSDLSPMRLHPPRLPTPAQTLLLNNPSRTRSSTLTPQSPIETTGGVSGAYGIDPRGKAGKAIEHKGVRPRGSSVETAKYSGRALAEWELVVWECQSFFERRRGEGCPSNAMVETPTLGVEAFRRPG